ncbi:MAG: hypothetical protein ACI90V_005481, partial [Bacillariaceae sp.]
GFGACPKVCLKIKIIALLLSWPKLCAFKVVLCTTVNSERKLQ